MYWADWGNHPKIETAAMDGTMRETLVEENIQWPTGKTLSHQDINLPLLPCRWCQNPVVKTWFMTKRAVTTLLLNTGA